MVLRSFTLDLLHAGKVVYRHNSTNRNLHDHVLFQASDGFNTLNVMFKVDVRFKASLTHTRVFILL